MKPLAYDSLKTVLSYMEPNLRILLSRNLPTIQLAEKSVKLKIENLEVAQSGIRINDTSYKLGVMTFYPTQNGYTPAQSWDTRCAKNFDLDKYGFCSPYPEPTPGDLNFLDPIRPEESEELIRMSLGEIQRYDADGNGDTKFKSAYWKYLTHHMEMYRCRRELVEPTYKHFLCLATGNDQWEFMGYNGNYFTTLKYLMSKIFGGREPIYVKNFKITAIGRLCLPRDFKLHLENLKAENQNKCLEVIRPLMTDSSFSLKCIDVRVLHSEDYPILCQAEKVIVFSHENMNAVSTFPFKRLSITYTELTREQLLQIVRDWQRDKREVGTHYTFHTSHHDGGQAQAYAVLLGQQPDAEFKDGTRFTDYIPQYTFPINEHTGIQIDLHSKTSAHSEKCCINIKVQRRQQYVANEVHLSESCLKAVLGGMTAGFRLFLVQKLPTIRTVEKETPLKIETLYIDPYAICLDATFFKLNVRRYDQHDGPLKPVSRDEYNDKLPEVDKYGIKVLSFHKAPEDLDFGIKFEEEKTEDALSKQLEEFKRAYDKSLERDSPHRSEESIRLFKVEVENLEWKLERFRLRNNNEEPQYKFFLNFEWNNSGYKKTEVLEYCQNYGVAARYLWRKILGDRKNAILIKNFTVKAEKDFLRLPEQLKLVVKNLSVGGNRNGLGIFKPILANYSLNSIEMDRFVEGDEPFLTSVGKIKMMQSLARKPWEKPVVPSLKIQNLEFTFLSHGQVMVILKEWRTTPAAVGTKWAFKARHTEHIACLEEISKEPGAELGAVGGKRSDYPPVTIPINQELKIHASIQKTVELASLESNLNNRYAMYEVPPGYLQLEVKRRTIDAELH